MAARIYVDGVFDLFHTGHLSFLNKAKQVAENSQLVVGVISDKDAQWKRQPILSHIQRLELVKNCKIVDEVIDNAPLVLTEEFIKENKITHVVHGDDDKQEEFFKIPIKLGIMYYVPYTNDGPLAISTTKLIEKIKYNK